MSAGVSNYFIRFFMLVTRYGFEYGAIYSAYEIKWEYQIRRITAGR